MHFFVAIILTSVLAYGQVITQAAAPSASAPTLTWALTLDTNVIPVFNGNTTDGRVLASKNVNGTISGTVNGTITGGTSLVTFGLGDSFTFSGVLYGTTDDNRSFTFENVVQGTKQHSWGKGTSWVEGDLDVGYYLCIAQPKTSGSTVSAGNLNCFTVS